jgi:Arm domain-containing DNA-binding protein
MAKIKLTKTAVDAAIPGVKEYELHDTIVPGFLLKLAPAGRKIFMVQYRTNAGERRKPAIGRFGELTFEQARSIAQDWLADVRRGKDPSAEKTAARGAPSMKELCSKFMEDYSTPKKPGENGRKQPRRRKQPRLCRPPHRSQSRRPQSARHQPRGCFRLNHADEKDPRNRSSKTGTMPRPRRLTPIGHFEIRAVQTARFHRGQGEPSTPAPR